MNRSKWLLAALILLLVVAWALPAAAIDFFPLADVKAGQHGTGRTVIHGTQISEFDVEILGVLKGAGPAGDLILIRVGGPVIDETGGIAQGMSGSPVYIDGKLVGAISYGFSFADHRVGFVTPAESMQEVGRLAGGIGSPVMALPQLPGIVRLTTPVMVGGAGPREMAKLTAALAPYGLSPVQGATGAAVAGESAPLEAGSAFGAQLISGDMDMTAIGTVTYVDGDTLVGFGHPFMNKGPVNMTITGAYVYTTVQSVEAPFKLGSALGEAGVLTQDRPAGVAGKLGGKADMIPLTVQVHDEDLKKDTNFQVKVVKDETLSLELLGVSALQGLDKGLSRIGQGTADVKFTFRGEGIPGGEISRSNIFFSSADISVVSLREYVEAGRLLLNNKFKAVNITDASLSVNVRGERRTAGIEKAEPERAEAKRGDKIQVSVTLQPYRNEPQKVALTLPIPADFPTGTFNVVVRGGGVMVGQEGDEDLQEQPQTDAKGNRVEAPGAKPKTTVDNFDKLIQDFLKRSKNNEIVLELWPIPTGGHGDSDVAPPAASRMGAGPAANPLEPVRVTQSVPFVLEGSTSFQLTVAPNEQPKKKFTWPWSSAKSK